MRACLTCVETRGVLLPNVLESFEDAARRWRIDFYPVLQEIAPREHPFAQKLRVSRVCEDAGYDWVLQLDTDILIRGDAPCPIPLVPDRHLGLVEEPIWKAGSVRALYTDAAKDTVLPFAGATLFANAGMLVYQPAVWRERFGRIHQMTVRRLHSHAFAEQTTLNQLAAREGWPITKLPDTFNWVSPPQRPLGGDRYLPGYFTHFICHQNKTQRMLNAPDWRNTP